MDKPFNGFNHGKGQIDLSHLSGVIRVKPVEVHLKEDGPFDEKPSFAFVMVSGNLLTVAGEISLQMINEGLKDIGYKMIKLNDNGHRA